MSNNFNFENAIQEGLRLGQERLDTKDKIKEILESFASDLQRILSEQYNKQISVQTRHVIIRKKLPPIAAIAAIGFEDPPIEEEYDAVCLFDKSTIKDPFVVFRYEIDPIEVSLVKYDALATSFLAMMKLLLLQLLKIQLKTEDWQSSNKYGILQKIQMNRKLSKGILLFYS